MMQYFIILILFNIISIISQTNGFTLKMIPIDSPRLKVYPNNMTTQERYELLTNITISRANNVQFRTKNITQNSIQSKIYRFANSYYATQLAFGTGEGVYAPFVHLDTGTSYTWVQCQGCSPCFELATTNFRFTRSTSFARMDLHDPRCVPQKSFLYSCGFSEKYPQSEVHGLLATETFGFEDTRSNNQLIRFQNIVFGCALQCYNMKFGDNIAHPNLIAGIFGLALRGPESFVKQLDEPIKGKFLYCITSSIESHPGESTMHFGDDANFNEDEQRRLKVVSMHTSQVYHLYVNGISVDGKRLAIDPNVFELDESTYSRGFFIDSGAPFSYLAAGAYDPLHEAVARYFYDNYGWRPMGHGPFGLTLCYSAYPGRHQEFPSVVFHFRYNAQQGEDVDMVMDQSNMFNKYLNTDGFCIMVYRNGYDSYSLFGAFQHANFKVLYDLRAGLFSFVPVRCQEN